MIGQRGLVLWIVSVVYKSNYGCGWVFVGRHVREHEMGRLRIVPCELFLTFGGV